MATSIPGAENISDSLMKAINAVVDNRLAELGITGTPPIPTEPESGGDGGNEETP